MLRRLDDGRGGCGAHFDEVREARPPRARGRNDEIYARLVAAEIEPYYTTVQRGPISTLAKA